MHFYFIYDLRASNERNLVFGFFDYDLCYDSKEDTLPMAVILSSLRDSGELSLMNGDNNLGGINLPRLWLLFFRNVNIFIAPGCSSQELSGRSVRSEYKPNKD